MENKLTKNDYKILAEIVREQIDHCNKMESETEDNVQKAFWNDSADHFIQLLSRIPSDKE